MTTTKVNNKDFKNLVIALMDDGNGINEKAYGLLSAMAALVMVEEYKPFFDQVRSSKGRYYLPEDFRRDS